MFSSKEVLSVLYISKKQHIVLFNMNRNNFLFGKSNSIELIRFLTNTISSMINISDTTLENKTKVIFFDQSFHRKWYLHITK